MCLFFLGLVQKTQTKRLESGSFLRSHVSLPYPLLPWSSDARMSQEQSKELGLRQGLGWVGGATAALGKRGGGVGVGAARQEGCPAPRSQV